MDFPSREELKKRNAGKVSDYQNKIIESIKGIDVNNFDFDKADYTMKNEVTEKQKVYFWIRLYLGEVESDLEPNDDIAIKYNYSSTGEELVTKFICFAKMGVENSSNTKVDEEITGYTPEDNKKVLCLMVDSERINSNSDDIPFIRTLFKISKYYEYQLMRRDNLSFINLRTGKVLNYFDVDF